MSRKIAVAAMFRHKPDEDGMAIPASVEVEHPKYRGETFCHPIIGFMAVKPEGGRTVWCFMKYEAPFYMATGPVKIARFSTTRVGHVGCPHCGNSCLYPVWGRPGNFPCPACWSKGVDIAYVKETSEEFDQLLGELRQPLEEAVDSVDLETAEEFRYPELMLLGRLEPSMGVDPLMQGKAAETGRTLRLGREATVEELMSTDMDGDDTGLLLMPGVTSGVLDLERVREGWNVTEGIVYSSVKLPFLKPEPPKPRRFGGARL